VVLQLSNGNNWSHGKETLLRFGDKCLFLALSGSRANGIPRLRADQHG
jgi:hypothetical protein